MNGERISARRAWRDGHRGFGVRVRLLLAFLAIAAFSVLAAAAGLYAFREVGGRLDVIDTRVPRTISAFELSRAAERIIAAAPALLATTDRTRRDGLKAELAREVESLNERLSGLQEGGSSTLPLGRIEPLVSSLTARLQDLDDLVARRLETSDRVMNLRHEVFRTNAEVQRLLGPWLQVTGSEIASLVEGAPGGPVEEPHPRLASLIKQQRLTQTAAAQVSGVADMLAEASTAERRERLTVLHFQLGLALHDLEETAGGLDPKLRPLFLERVERLRQFVEGRDSVIDIRLRELGLIGEGERLLAETAALSARLTAAVDRLGGAAKADIGRAIDDALSVQRLSTRTLIVLGALSLLTSILIVWLYVGGSIVRRLTALSEDMLAIAGGRFGTPVEVRGRDEIAAMARAVEVFRRNAVELERLLEERKSAAARLEQQVVARTRDLAEKSRQLENANRYKSHFLASASHDLRQPLHALNLFVAQLHGETDASRRRRLVGRVDAAVASMNELFESLLDMSKLEAGMLEPQFAEFPIERALERMETTFADPARQKGLRLSIVRSGVMVRSDPILLERILMNLVSNAVGYTAQGGVVVGCRRRGGHLRIDVCDSGPGFAKAQERRIFGEYYRLAADGPNSGRNRGGGLGLGLAIVERLGRLLDHEVTIESSPGRGSRFSVSVPLVAEHQGAAGVEPSPLVGDPARGRLVLVIDDDPLALEGMSGVLHGWGCRFLAAASEETALSAIAATGTPPDLIIADYRLVDGSTGTQAIERLRRALGAQVPAFLISGDTAPEALREARAHGLHLLHKPVPPMRLRAILTRLLTAPGQTDPSMSAAE